MKIIIFTPTQDISTNPTLINLIYRLSEDGIPIDIYQPTKQGCYLPLETNNKNVKLFKYHYLTPVTISEFNLYSLIRLIYHISRSIFYLSDKLKISLRMLLDERVVILAVDTWGAIEAYKYSKWWKIPFAYLSFELFFMSELHSKDRKKIKKKEILASQNAAFIVIQDQQRGNLLEIENNLSSQQMFYMPVAPSATPSVKTNLYLREKFNIPEDKTIVIHAGSFASWTYAEELIQSTQYWPKDFVLVVHTRYYIGKDKYIEQLLENNKTMNIIFSTEPCNDFIYHELLSSADIGLVLYKPTGISPNGCKNIETVGLSSGKFSYYMKCGIPSISIKQQQYRELLKVYSFGLDINNFGELPAALLTIKNNYSQYSNEAKKLFYEKLNFDIYYPTLKKKLLNLM